ncbi:hypothetical protein D3C76_1352920 [compost metagenome]
MPWTGRKVTANASPNANPCRPNCPAYIVTAEWKSGARNKVQARNTNSSVNVCDSRGGTLGRLERDHRRSTHRAMPCAEPHNR